MYAVVGPIRPFCKCFNVLEVMRWLSMNAAGKQPSDGRSEESGADLVGWHPSLYYYRYSK